MRNTSGDERGVWGSYVKTARERSRGGAGISQSEFARLLKVDRATVHRWEKAQQRPEDARTVAAVAEILGLDQDEALAAAGLKPGTPAPVEPTQERDEEIDLILSDPRLDDDMKRRILERLFQLRDRDKARRMDDIRFLIEQQRRPRRAG